MSIFKKIFSTGAKEVVSTVGTVLDNLITSKEEKEAAKLAIEQEINRHMEAIMHDTTRQTELILADKQSARDMYKHNSGLQKIFALCFLGMYMALSILMLCKILGVFGVEVPKIDEFGTIWISTLWGGMTAKLNTITDFLFGAGMDKKE